jgi:hypothetical protein
MSLFFICHLVIQGIVGGTGIFEQGQDTAEQKQPFGSVHVLIQSPRLLDFLGAPFVEFPPATCDIAFACAYPHLDETALDEPLAIGWKLNGTESDRFSGVIHEVWIYNYALLPTEIGELYSQGVTRCGRSVA